MSDASAPTDALTDAALLARSAAGEADAYEVFVTRHAASRLRQRHAREPLDDTPVEDLGAEAGWGRADPELPAMGHQLQVAASAALAALPDEDREILTVRDLEGATGEQAAALLGLTVPAMKSRLHRARLRLAAQFRKGGHDVAR